MYLLLRDDLRDPLLRTPGCRGRAPTSKPSAPESEIPALRSGRRRSHEKQNATRAIKHHPAPGCSPVLSVRRIVALVPPVVLTLGRPCPRAGLAAEPPDPGRRAPTGRPRRRSPAPPPPARPADRPKRRS